MTPMEIRSAVELQSAVRAATAEALARDTRTLLWVDPDFVAWPLGDGPLLDSLATWLRRPLRRLVLLGGHWGRLEQAHPRFRQWRETWSHGVHACEPSDLAVDALPTLLLDDGPVVMELWERDPPRGRALRDAAVAAAARDRIDAHLQRSAAAWPVKPLGL